MRGLTCRDVIAPLATILTPNQFECELLAGVPIRDTASAVAAMDILHARGSRTVVITSSELPLGQTDHMLLLASTPWGASRGSSLPPGCIGE
jgi:pyridoxine kinase